LLCKGARRRRHGAWGGGGISAGMAGENPPRPGVAEERPKSGVRAGAPTPTPDLPGFGCPPGKSGAPCPVPVESKVEVGWVTGAATSGRAPRPAK
jgi:hypothetical protein